MVGGPVSQDVTALIVAAMEEEAAPFLAEGTPEEIEVPIGQAWRVSVGGADAVVLRCGVGLVNAAAAVGYVAARLAPKAIISVGSAGGLAEGIYVGDVVVGTAFTYSDADATAFGYAPGQVPGMPPQFEADPQLVRLAVHRRAHGVRVWPGKIVSGNTFVTADTVEAVRATFPGTMAADMESAAAAQTAFLLGIPFVSVRGISDLCGPDAGHDFKIALEEVAERAAAVACDVVRGLRG